MSWVVTFIDIEIMLKLCSWHICDTAAGVNFSIYPKHVTQTNIVTCFMFEANSPDQWLDGNLITVGYTSQAGIIRPT